MYLECIYISLTPFLVAQLVTNLPATQKTPVDPSSAPGLGRSPGEGTGYPLQYSWASNSKESTCNAGDGFDPWVGKILWRTAWQPTPGFLFGETPWTEEPVGLQSMWSQRVGDDWATKHTTPFPKSSLAWQLQLTPNPPPQNKARLYHCSHVKSSQFKVLPISSSHLIQFFTLSHQMLLSQWLSVFGNYQILFSFSPQFSSLALRIARSFPCHHKVRDYIFVRTPVLFPSLHYLQSVSVLLHNLCKFYKTFCCISSIYAIYKYLLNESLFK